MRFNSEKKSFFNVFDAIGDLESKKNTRVGFFRNNTVYKPLKKTIMPFEDKLVFVHRECAKWKSRTKTFTRRLDGESRLGGTKSEIGKGAECKTPGFENTGDKEEEKKLVFCARPKIVIKRKIGKRKRREEKKENLNEFDLNPWDCDSVIIK